MMTPRFLDHIYRFGAVERDSWVESCAREVPAGAKVLDVGAGPCRYRSFFSHCDYRAQDFALYEGSVTPIANDLDTWKYGRLDYVCDATDIPVPAGEFDAVLCTEVLEHVPRPIDVMRECARVLRPGGTLLVTAPLGSGLHQEPYHYYGGFTPYWYREILDELGFESLEIRPNGGFFRHFGQECQRFSALLHPRRTRRRLLPLLFPLWLLSLPTLRLGMPVACHLLDRLDEHRGFTVGYHVKAVRTAVPPAQASR